MQSRWSVSVTQAGFHGFHFHDVRYTGKTLAADIWASPADLMTRMGHGSARAALRDTPRLRPACRAWLVLPLTFYFSQNDHPVYVSFLGWSLVRPN
jgi:integrase